MRCQCRTSSFVLYRITRIYLSCVPQNSILRLHNHHDCGCMRELGVEFLPSSIFILFYYIPLRPAFFPVWSLPSLLPIIYTRTHVSCFWHPISFSGIYDAQFRKYCVSQCFNYFNPFAILGVTMVTVQCNNRTWYDLNFKFKFDLGRPRTCTEGPNRAKQSKEKTNK